MTTASKQLNQYKIQSLFGGWTRVDMLLELYSRAVGAIEKIKLAQQDGDQSAYVDAFIEAQKTILAIHSGLKPDEYDIAFNIARLLHFVLTCLEQNNFDDAIKILSELRSGFDAIREEANTLEHSGEISPMPAGDAFRVDA